MRAQMIFQRSKKGTDQRAQGTDGAQIADLICALAKYCFYFLFLLKGTGHRYKYKPYIIIKIGENKEKQRKRAPKKEIQRNAFYLCPVPSTASLETVA